MKEIKFIEDVVLEGRRVLTRLDLNVPLDNNAQITDDSRIKSSLKTIRYIIDKGGKAILMSHLGRPNGERLENMSLKPLSDRIVVKPEAAEEKTASGIILPDTAQEKPQMGKVMAGGPGRRLLPFTQKKPKALIKVYNKPMTEHIIQRAKSFGFFNFVLSINYFGNQIKNYFKDG